MNITEKYLRLLEEGSFPLFLNSDNERAVNLETAERLLQDFEIEIRNDCEYKENY